MSNRLTVRPRLIRLSRWIGPAAILLLAIALRIPGLFSNFWGDEIWSWQIASQLHSATDILLSPLAHSDNNHPLNTLWLYLLSIHSRIWLYRLPALVAGVATVAVAMHSMFRRGRIAGLSAGLLTASSFPLVFYSSEARGYSLCVFFAVLAFDSLDLALNNRRVWWSWIFSIACVLGLLSHLTFFHVYAAAVVWSMVRLRGRWRPLLKLHAVPAATLLLLWVVFISKLNFVGASPTDPYSTIFDAWALPLGGPTGWSVACVAWALVAVALFALAQWRLREKASTWLFYTSVVVVFPALAIIHELSMSANPQPLMVRYFLVCMPFMLLSVCPLIQAGVLSKKIWQITLVAVGAAAFLAGNAIHFAQFATFGRGQPAAALQRIADATAGTITITSDNLPPTRLLLSFYSPRLTPPRRIELSDDPVEWLILNRQSSSAHHAVEFRGVRYVLDSIYASAGLSGWTWIVYRRGDVPFH